jgi:hypothetical protein
MTTRWKDNFKDFTMEQWLSTCSILEDEEKFVEVEAVIKDNMEGGEDELRNNWERDSWRKAGVEGQSSYDDDLPAWW